MLASNPYVWWAAQVVAVAILVALFLHWRPKFMGRRTIGETVGTLLDQRAAQIQAQLEAAQRSREEAARIQEQSAQDIEQARQEAEQIVTRAAQTGEAVRQELEQRARDEYQRIVAQARVEIEFEREQAEMALKRRAADIVIDAAGQIVERNLDAQSDLRIIDRSLADVRDLQ